MRLPWPSATPSRQQLSWLTVRAQSNITRSKQEALSILSSHRSEILASSDPSATFASLASQHSDCSSHTHGGDLGPFGRGQMQKPFEDATYGLKVGEISDVVDTESGVHIILRTA